MKEVKVIIIILLQYALSTYLSIYALHKVLTINVLDLLVPIKIVLAVLSSLICFFTINILIYRLVITFKKQKEGVYKLGSNEYLYWFYKGVVRNILLKLLDLILGGYGLFPLIYKALGAKISLSSIISAQSLSDPEFISVGNNSVIGGKACVLAHVIEKGSLIIKRISIGDNCVIGVGSIIMPGVTIGDNAIIAANSTVLKNQKIKKGEMWGGSPARLIKKR